MTHWPWYAGGAALAGVAVFHWLALHRMMAVSGRYSALVNRLRFGAPRPSRSRAPRTGRPGAAAIRGPPRR